jgi:hypothetical protein
MKPKVNSDTFYSSGKHEVMFPIIRFLTQQILKIVSSQIEIKMVKTHLKKA